MSDELVKEWWIAFAGNPVYDRETAERMVGVITPTRFPGEDIISVVDKVSYERVLRERDEARAEVTRLRDALVRQNA